MAQGADPVGLTDPVAAALDEGEDLDVAVVAHRQDGAWRLAQLPDGALDGLEDLVVELGRCPGEDALGLLAVAEDFALLLRVQGARVRLLLTDAGAAEGWALAREALAQVPAAGDTPGSEHDVADRADATGEGPVGDLGLLADLGVAAGRLEELLGQDDPYPEDVLADVADALGFGEDFDDLTGLGR